MKRIKRIIAREGLVFLAIALLSVFCGERGYRFFWTNFVPQCDLPLNLDFQPQSTLGGAILDSFKSLYLIYLSFWVIYFIIRFIIWAIRTLKQKE